MDLETQTNAEQQKTDTRSAIEIAQDYDAGDSVIGFLKTASIFTGDLDLVKVGRIGVQLRFFRSTPNGLFDRALENGLTHFEVEQDIFGDDRCVLVTLQEGDFEVTKR